MSLDDEKGIGSAYGGGWKPKKADDERYLGRPGEIKVTVMKNGETFYTKIGEDRRAVMERHCTDHRTPWIHTNPHDHEIFWDNPSGHPDPGEHINYPDGAPEFKRYKGEDNMEIIIVEDDGHMNFESISDFKWCLHYGGEVEFEWKGKAYSIIHPEGKICICEGVYLKDGKYYNALSHTECVNYHGLWADTPDGILEYTMDGDRLRDVITQVHVTERTV